MHSFVTPDPVTIEVRSPAGAVHVDLTDTDKTTVDVSLTANGPLGFVDEIVRAFGGRRTDGADGTEQHRTRWWEQPSGPEAAEILGRVRVECTEQGDGRTVLVDTDPASRGWRTAFVVRITAPAGSGVRAFTQSADVTVSGAASRLDIRTASGDVVTGDATGDARIQTASGDIRLQSVDGTLSCRSASGAIEAVRIDGAATLHTTSGHVRVRTAAGDLEARTVSGDVRVADTSAGRITITAVSGDVEVGVHPGSPAAVNLTTISGDARSELAVTDEPTRPEPTGEPIPDTAGAALDIRVRTTSGNIRLRRAVAV